MKHRFQSKITPDQQLEVCNLLARFTPVAEVKKKVAVWGQTISEQGLRWYLNDPKWKTIVTRLRSEYLTEILEVPIAHKRVRLERLDSLYKTAVNKGNIAVAKDVLRAAQEEIEHKPGNVSIIMNKIEMISDTELKERVRRIKEEFLHIEDKTFENSEVADVVA